MYISTVVLLRFFIFTAAVHIPFVHIQFVLLPLTP
jgi:hypothetical protein